MTFGELILYLLGICFVIAVVKLTIDTHPQLAIAGVLCLVAWAIITALKERDER